MNEKDNCKKTVVKEIGIKRLNCEECEQNYIQSDQECLTENNSNNSNGKITHPPVNNTLN